MPLLPPKKQDTSVLLTLTGSRRIRTLQRKRAKERKKQALIEGPKCAADVAKIMRWRISRKTRRIAARAKVKAVAAAAAATLAPPVANTGTVAPPVFGAAAPVAKPPKPAKPVIVLRLKSGEVVGSTRPAVKAGDTAATVANVT